MRVLGISARARHGKDTCAKIIQKIAARAGANLALFPFALPLKARAYAALDGEYTFEDVFDNKPPAVREMLQQEGTERGRNVYGTDFWTRQAEAFIRTFEESMPFLDGVIIPDVRFPNELKFAQYAGRTERDVEAEVREVVVSRIKYAYADFEYTYAHASEELQHRIDTFFYDEMSRGLMKYEAERPGMSLFIQSDRPTLTGDAALHPSETALDHLDKALAFDAIVVNNRDTTLEDLEKQLIPITNQFLSL